MKAQLKKVITHANEFARERLAAIARVQAGETMYAVAKSIGVDQTTISDWVRWYETEGIERLNVPRKTIPRHHLDAAELQEKINLETDENKKVMLSSLLELAQGKGLLDVAKKYGISPQGLAKRRRMYLK